MSMWQQWSTQRKKIDDIFVGNELPTFNAEEVKGFLAKIPEEFRGLELGMDENASVAANSLKEFFRYLPLLKHGGGYALQLVGNEINVILFTQDNKMVFKFARDGGLDYTMFTKYGGHSLYRRRLHGELTIVDDVDLFIIEKVLKFMLP